MLKCPKCGSLNSFDSTVCYKCNEKLNDGKKQTDNDDEFERLLKMQFNKEVSSQNTTKTTNKNLNSQKQDDLGEDIDDFKIFSYPLELEDKLVALIKKSDNEGYSIEDDASNSPSPMKDNDFEIKEESKEEYLENAAPLINNKNESSPVKETSVKFNDEDIRDHKSSIMDEVIDNDIISHEVIGSNDPITKELNDDFEFKLKENFKLKSKIKDEDTISDLSSNNVNGGKVIREDLENYSKDNDIATKNISSNDSTVRLKKTDDFDEFYDESHLVPSNGDDEEVDLEDLDEIIEEEDDHKILKYLLSLVIGLVLISSLAFLLYNFVLRDLRDVSNADKYVANEQYSEAINIYDKLMKKSPTDAIAVKKAKAEKLLFEKSILQKELNQITPDDFKNIVEISKNSELYSQEAELIKTNIENELVNAAQAKLDTNNITGAAETIKPFLSVTDGSAALNEMYVRISDKQDSITKNQSSSNTQVRTNAIGNESTMTNKNNELVGVKSSKATESPLTIDVYFDTYLKNIVSSINNNTPETIEKFIDEKSKIYDVQKSYIEDSFKEGKTLNFVNKQILDVIKIEEGYEVISLETIEITKENKKEVNASTIKYILEEKDSPYGFLITDITPVN